MTPVVRNVVGRLVTGTQNLGRSVQKNGRLDFTRVHVRQQRRDDSGVFPRRLPVLRGREERHPLTARGRLLDDVAQHVVAAVPVDQHERVDTRAAQRVGDVPHHGVQGHGGDGHRARPGRVLVRTGDGHRRKEVHGVGAGDRPCDRAGDQGVRRQGQEGTVLFMTSDRKYRDLT
ncbi:hypothetical protein GCM10010267_15790 [Streptomyces griseorubens]|nr:hypothetical protein GCM10010267_15790 [Streptomyces griseorubens]